MPAIHKTLMLCCALAFPGPAAAADATPEQVHIKAMRDPAMLSYKAMYEVLSRAQPTMEHVQITFRVVSNATSQPVPDLAIDLVGNTRKRALSIAPDGILDVPVDAALYADDADFISNQKRGTLRILASVTPRLPASDLRYGDLLDAIDAGSHAADDIIAHLLPWYLRMLGAGIDSVAICYPEAGRAVRFQGANAAVAATARPASHKVRTAVTRQMVWCARFNSHEAGLARETVIEPDPGWIGEY